MELVLMVLLPFPLGFRVRQRLVAFVAYTAAHAFVFTVQTALLVLEWAGGSSRAFGGVFPEHRLSEFLGYVAVNLIIYAVGLGLVVLGHRAASTRRDTPASSVGQH